MPSLQFSTLTRLASCDESENDTCSFIPSSSTLSEAADDMAHTHTEREKLGSCRNVSWGFSYIIWVMFISRRRGSSQKSLPNTRENVWHSSVEAREGSL